jgi:hypothetical protein
MVTIVGGMIGLCPLENFILWKHILEKCIENIGKPLLDTLSLETYIGNVSKNV